MFEEKAADVLPWTAKYKDLNIIENILEVIARVVYHELGNFCTVAELQEVVI